jgi:hypothetical protein
VFNRADGVFSSVVGGDRNTASEAFAFVGGGQSNAASGGWATVGGGGGNAASGAVSTVGGGLVNTASGNFSTVPGGESNSADGDFSFAAGRFAKAMHLGTFVWADSTVADFASTGDHQFLIHATGNVGINTNAPAYTLDVNGTIRGNNVSPSDARFKTNVQTFDNALEAILNLRGVTFDWDRPAWKEKNFPDGRQIGFIAQEVEQVLPELVSTDRAGYKSVAYANVVPVLVEAIKQQQKQLDAVRTENARLKSRLKQMESMQSQLSALSARLAQVEAQQVRH